MKQFRWKIIVCLIPVLISLFAVSRAYYLYQQGKGGFRLGVDLVGGTILVYEVDQDRMQNLQKGKDYKPEDLAAALKRRLDPSDQFNITVRAVGNDRVEIILPTGGQQQAVKQAAAWNAILQQASDKWPPPEGKDYSDIPVNDTQALRERIRAFDDTADPADFINSLRDEKRQVTSEEVQEFKELIAQVGSLEFRILANREDDKDAIQAAENQIKDLSKSETKDDKRVPSPLDKLAEEGKPPPPPNDGKPFDNGYTYSWVELGRSERHSLHLNNAAKDDKRYSYWRQLAQAREQNEATTLKDRTPEGLPVVIMSGALFYSRQIPKTTRELSKKDRDKEYEYFVLSRDPESEDKRITGDYLTDASVSERDLKPIVLFRFNARGGDLFQDLTTKNRPTGTKESAFRRYLAILLDGQIVSAPTINAIIRTDGEISGNFTRPEVERLVRILRAGALPATLKPIPVSENTMGATLGADTVKWGSISVLVAFAAILLFMLVYYRFAGFVACLALLCNLLMTVAFMVMFGAAFTLPGLAGLVLMLGMAVDANVLIYERLREERDRGASLPLAIRNGYDRAFPTIIDTHLTSIFTAIVLYVVGNDQLKGFGVSLTVGLIISLFTSLFMTRLMFDIWLFKGWLKQLRMMRFLTKPNIDFMAIRYYWFAFTIILTVVGLTIFLIRGRSGLNIDFIGGTAYSGQLANAHAMDVTELRGKLGDDQQKQRLAIDDVEQIGDDGRTFRITYKDRVRIGTTESNTETVSLSNATTVDDVRRRAQQLPDLSVEQIFLSSDPAPQPKSHYFTVRTSEKAPELVLASINRLLGDELKRIELTKKEFDEKNKQITLEFLDPETNTAAYASPAQVTMLLQRELRAEGLAGLAQHLQLTKAKEGEEKDGRRKSITYTFRDEVPAAKVRAALDKTKAAFASRPQPERLENFDSQLAAETQGRALLAIGFSWGAILLYLWFRFGSWTFGMAAVLCLIHDLCFTLGMIAFCHYIHHSMPGFATVLGLHDFKIDLPAVAALLTLVGYSVSDTIVVFDRIREVRGKNPLLTPQMINDSVNQTLSRTLLTAFSVWLVVFVLYALGGEGVHLFAFVMVVGVIVGTYSSIYIASPLLLIFGEGAPKARARQPQPAGISA
jgi:SecD/SecF fusion protein